MAAPVPTGTPFDIATVLAGGFLSQPAGPSISEAGGTARIDGAFSVGGAGASGPGIAALGSTLATVAPYALIGLGALVFVRLLK